ncbi:phage tail assembly protein [Ancylobacter terrae]|uniref:phage tail assembly protein n=1 Tax=Ancylobacter sp. sgz301288 TaxID=3342077 RepID=UPI0038591325
MDIVTKALTPAEIAAIEAGQQPASASIREAEPAVRPVVNAGPVTLEFPVTHDGITYTQIDVSNPVVGVLEQIQDAARDTPEPKLTFLMISLFAEIPIDVVRKLRRSDFERIVQSLGGAALTEAPGPLD